MHQSQKPMNEFSLRSRIFLSYFVLITLAALSINWVAIQQIQEVTATLFEENFSEKVDLALGEVEAYLLTIQEMDSEARTVEEFTAVDEQFYGELDELADDLNITIRLLDLGGVFVFYDTSTGVGEYDVEISEDVMMLFETDEPFVGWLEEIDIYASSSTVFIDDEPELILRVTETESTIATTSRTRIVALIGTTLVMGFVLFLGLGGWLSNAITQPLTRLRHSAQEMAAGKLDTRADTAAPREVGLLAADFNEMATAVERMMVEQRAFASNAAHELRTPLTAIRLRTETLLEDNPDEALQMRYIGEIQEEVKRLGRLVDDLRILSRADADRLETGSEQIDLAHLLASLKREFASVLTEKNLSLQIELPNPPYMVQASSNHIRTALRNVLENAVKYTPTGGKITVIVTKQSHSLSIQVSDNGIGIDPDDLPQLFNRFFRADKAHSRKVAGTGLGLSLVNSIVSLYGGQIRISSDGLGQGTDVSITWPRQILPDTAASF